MYDCILRTFGQGNQTTIKGYKSTIHTSIVPNYTTETINCTYLNLASNYLRTLQTDRRPLQDTELSRFMYRTHRNGVK